MRRCSTHAGRFIGAQTRIMLEADEQDLMPDTEASRFSATAAKQASGCVCLIRFFRNRRSTSSTERLKSIFSLNIQADDNDEPFSLNALERYMLQAQLLTMP